MPLKVDCFGTLGNCSIPLIRFPRNRSDVISDTRALQAEFVPREVEHRDGEVDALTNALDPYHARRGETAFLFGPSGTGKSCITQ